MLKAEGAHAVQELASPRSPSAWETIWGALLVAHATVALGAWWLLPHGFPVSHGRFWLNQVLPWLMVIVVLGVRVVPALGTPRPMALAAAALAGGWIGAVAALRMLFPVSAGWWWVLALAFAGALCVGVRPRGSAAQPMSALGPLSAGGVGAVLGLLMMAQLAPAASSTHPIGALAEPLPEVQDLQGTVPSSVSLASGVTVNPATSVVAITSPTVALEIRPLLRFQSKSPDGFLTLLAPPDFRRGGRRKVEGWQNQPGEVRLRYSGDIESTLVARAGAGNTLVEIEVTSRLESVVWSHLNSWCHIAVSGHSDLSLSFSPCPDTAVEVLPSEYPVGMPARLAYRDAQGGFHVVEAASAEKGPFRELAGGKLGAQEPLWVEVRDQGEAVFRIVLEDWAAQASTALSPTAGWGLPVNAIEMRRRNLNVASSVDLWFTLGSTSVGRGWDCVGHAPGVYRNKLRVEKMR